MGTINLNDPKELILIRRRVYDLTKVEVGGRLTNRFTGWHLIEPRVNGVPQGKFLEPPSKTWWLEKLDGSFAGADAFVDRQDLVDSTMLFDIDVVFDDIEGQLKAAPGTFDAC